MASPGSKPSRWGAIGALLVLAVGCVNEFVTDPPRAVTFERAAGWRDSLSVTDVETLTVQVTDSSRGESIVGLALTWVSSDPTVLELTPLDTTPGGAQRVTATARRRGRVQVRVTVQRPGFETRTFADSIVVLERWIAVSAGYEHTCAIAVAREVYCWGSGSGLGNGRTSDSIPSRVLGLAGYAFQSVSAGAGHTCALSVEGLMFCWGQNSSGQLGTGDTTSRLTATPAAFGLAFVALAAGWEFTCGVEAAGQASCWGRDRVGETGANAQQTGAFPCGLGRCTWGPVLYVVTKGSQTVKQSWISAGAEHACSVSTTTPTVPSGSVVCWGRAEAGQLGTGADTTLSACLQGTGSDVLCRSYAAPIISTEKFLSVAAGSGGQAAGRQTCGVAADHRIWCWGRNDRGQLGIGVADGPDMCAGFGKLALFPRPCATTPRLVGPQFRFVAVSVGGYHACSISTDGLAYCWGRNDVGQLGRGTNLGPETCDATPVGASSQEKSRECSTQPIEVVTNRRLSAVAAGERHTCALTVTDGALLCWGMNQGRLGNGRTADSFLPTRVAEPR